MRKTGLSKSGRMTEERYPILVISRNKNQKHKQLNAEVRVAPQLRMGKTGMLKTLAT